MTSINIRSFIDQLENQFKLNSNYEYGLSMSKYMKGHFVYFGINSPKRKEIQKQWIAELPKELDSSLRWEIVHELWQKEEREFQYVAIDWMNSWNKKWIEPTDSMEIRWLITSKSWWDSVDSIASNFLGKYCLKFPEEGSILIEDWRHDENMWLNRSCLIFQLKYGNQVDFDLLKSLVKQYQPYNTFFIQKAIGWSLRQYSKFNPKGVEEFVTQIDLKGLAMKEASKYLG